MFNEQKTEIVVLKRTVLKRAEARLKEGLRPGINNIFGHWPRLSSTVYRLCGQAGLWRPYVLRHWPQRWVNGVVLISRRFTFCSNPPLVVLSNRARRFGWYGHSKFSIRLVVVDGTACTDSIGDARNSKTSSSISSSSWVRRSQKFSSSVCVSVLTVVLSVCVPACRWAIARWTG